MKRRELVSGIATSLTLLISGCPESGMTIDKLRLLRFDSVEVKEDNTSNYTLEISVEGKARKYEEEDWAEFHNVRVVGYDDSKKRTCSKGLGNLQLEAEFKNYNLTLSCPKLPREIVLEARESPCDSNTRIDKAVYSRKDEGEHIYRIDIERECTSPPSETAEQFGDIAAIMASEHKIPRNEKTDSID